MDDADLVTRYNYDSFVREKFEPWMRFMASPPLGQPGPDHPLWDLEGRQTSLHAVCAQYRYTVVEFGSFT